MSDQVYVRALTGPTNPPVYTAERTTTDATPTLLWYIPMDDNAFWAFEIEVIGLGDDGSQAHRRVLALLTRFAGAAPAGTVADLVAATTTAGTVGVTGSGDDVVVTVTGGGRNTNWTMVCWRLVKLTAPAP